jgi:hypothetical protein
VTIAPHPTLPPPSPVAVTVSTPLPPLEGGRQLRDPMPFHASGEEDTAVASDDDPAPSAMMFNVPDAPAYLSYKPLCSSMLLHRLAAENRTGPPRAPPWIAFRGSTPQSPPPAFALSHIITYIAPFLGGPRDLEAAACTASLFRYGILYADVDVLPPRPLVRGRLFGARRRNPLLCACHDRPSPFLVFHHCWSLWTPQERQTLCLAFPIMTDYAKLRLAAASSFVAPLRLPRPPVTDDPIDHSRSWLMAVALLRFNFDYGDLVRWLGGEYTNAHRDWNDAFQQVDAVRQSPVPPDIPQWTLSELIVLALRASLWRDSMNVQLERLGSGSAMITTPR